jgi:hypothetical protein
MPVPPTRSSVTAATGYVTATLVVDTAAAVAILSGERSAEGLN